MAPPPRTRLDDAGPSAAAGGAAGEPGRMARLTRTAEAHMRAALAVARADEAEAPAHLARLVADAGAMLAAEIDNAAAGEPQQRALQARVACKKGCASCCYIPAAVTAVEAIGAAAAVARDPHLARQVAMLAPAIAAAGDVGRWRQRLACAMLGDGTCGIYADRPLACRAYVSLDAGRCEQALASGDMALQLALPLVELQRHLAAAIRAGIRAACVTAGVEDATIELNAGVARVLADPAVVPRWLAGKAVFGLTHS